MKDINTAMSICHKNGLKVFPEVFEGGFIVKSSHNGRPHIESERLNDKIGYEQK